MGSFDPLADERVRTPYENIADNTHDSARRLERIETSLRGLSAERLDADRVTLNNTETTKMLLIQIRDGVKHCFWALALIAILILFR